MKTKNKQTLGQKVERVLRGFIPVVQDSPRELTRKVAFLLAFLVFIGSAWYLVDDLLVQPQRTQETANTLRDWFYTPEDGEDEFADEGPDTTVYPEGMDPKFKRLYRNNNEVRGWLRFAAGEGDNDLFGGAVDNPVVQTADNDFYLNHDFWGEYDKAGTLFFDYRNDLNAGAYNRNVIIYGHNLKSGLMFSRFNKLASAKLERGRLLTTLTMDTLYEQRTYKVMAVMVLNVEESDGPVFNYLRTKFVHEKDFLNYVEEIRKRSLFDFGGVDVKPGDELLTLSTCSNKRDTTMKESRVVIVARRVREGEDPTVDPMLTSVNDDVLMPKAWYINKGLPVPQEYTETTTTTQSGTTIATSEVPTDPSGSTAPTSSGPTESTTLPSGETTTTATVPNATTTTTVPGATTTTAPGATTTATAAEETTATVQGEATTTTAEETTTVPSEETTTTASEETTTTVPEETTTTVTETTTTAAPTE